ncbi:MAG: penicillin-insensitive murein endopeptidase [Solirubrobacteraceae bacterium]
MAVALVVAAVGMGFAATASSQVPRAHSLAAPEPAVDDGQQPAAPGEADAVSVTWRASRALGQPWGGRLQDGVKLPPAGPDWFSWDPLLTRSPNRGWRRWGTDGLIRTLMKVLREYRSAHPDAPRVGIGDLSRELGGPFWELDGGRVHSSHQNGLDADVYYPRLDARERPPRAPRHVDERLAQDLVDRFVAAGAVKVFVGPRLDLSGPRRVVSKLVLHDDHMHVRIARPPE